MKKLKAVYDTKDDVPSEVLEYYSERDGKWILNPVDGMATDADLQRVKTALENEKTEHKKTKEKTRPYLDLGDDPVELQTKLDRIDELEAAAGGKIDEAKISQMVESRIKSRMAPVERERDKFKKDFEEAEGKVTVLATSISVGKIENQLRRAAETAKVIATAIDDVVAIGRSVFEVNGDDKVTSKEGGLTPDLWLSDMKTKRPHWWPGTEGSGATGSSTKTPSGGANPWASDSWNVTEQGKILREHGTEQAEKLAKAAGSFVGATAPKVKSK